METQTTSEPSVPHQNSTQRPAPPMPIELVGTEEERRAFIGAFAKAQGAFAQLTRTHTVKVRTKTGGEYVFDYAPLETILEATLPALNANGIMFTQPFYRDENDWILETMLLHSGGGGLRTRLKLPPLDLRDNENPTHKLGSLRTYFRRYMAESVFGVSAEDDDDGNMAMGNQAEKTRGGNQQRPQQTQQRPAQRPQERRQSPPSPPAESKPAEPQKPAPAPREEPKEEPTPETPRPQNAQAPSGAPYPVDPATGFRTLPESTIPRGDEHTDEQSDRIGELLRAKGFRKKTECQEYTGQFGINFADMDSRMFDQMIKALEADLDYEQGRV